MVHHKKLIEYRIATSNRSSNIQQKIDALRLVEDEDYQLLDIQQPVPQGRSADSAFGEGGYSTKKCTCLHQKRLKNVL